MRIIHSRAFDRKAIYQAFAGLFFFLCVSSSVQAGSFGVSPIRATLSAKQSVAALTVHNNSDQPSIVQVQLVEWSQHDGQDVLNPSNEILATPPIFTLPAGGTQVIRIGMRRAPDPKRELSYRIFLQEVPPPPGEGFQGLQVALRLSIPVFITPPVDAKPELIWNATPVDPGKLKLHVTNKGNAHIQIANITLSRQGGENLGSRQVASYVLPGESHEWIIPVSTHPGEILRLFAKTDGSDIESSLPVQSP